MIKTLIAFLHRIATALEAAAEKESQKAEAQLAKAQAAVEKAFGHRQSSRQAQQIASGIKDVTSPVPVGSSPGQALAAGSAMPTPAQAAEAQAEARAAEAGADAAAA